MRQVLAGVLLLVVGTGCAARSTYLARINDETITGKELRNEFARSHRGLEKILGDEKEIRKYVGRLVDRRLFVQEGYRMSLQDQPDVREAVARFRAQKVVEAFVRDELDDKSKATDEEVKAVHATIRHRSEVRQIVVRTQAEAEAIAAAVRAGADMEALAREKSIAPTAKRGGLTLMGWGGDEAYEAVLPSLAEGQVSAPFESSSGWEVLRLEKRTPLEPPPPYEKVAPRIRAILQQRKRIALEGVVYGELWARYEVKILECAPTLDDLRKASSAEGAPLCASWKGGTMTVADLAGRLKLDELGKLEGEWPALRKTFVEEFATREVLALEAEARGYALRPEIAEELKGHQDDLIERKLYSDYVTKGLAATDEDALRYYEAHKDQFLEDARYDLAQIAVDTAEEAAIVEEKVKSRQPFAEVAAAHSRDKDSADKGGRIGEVERRQLTGALAPVAALEEGGVSGVLKTTAGFHLVKVLGIRPERQRTFEEVKEQARERALQERKVAELDGWIQKLRAAARVEISEKGIRAYQKERLAWFAEQQEAERAKEEAAGKAAAGAHPGEHGGASPAPAAEGPNAKAQEPGAATAPGPAAALGAAPPSPATPPAPAAAPQPPAAGAPASR